MKSFIKSLLIIAIIAAIGYGGYVLYTKYFNKGGDTDIFSAIPADAVFVIETNNLTTGWKTVSTSKLWQHLIANPYFSDIQGQVNEFNKLIQEYESIDKLMSNRKLTVSAHTVSGNDFDFLFVVDLQKMANLSRVFTEALKIAGFEVNKRDFEKSEIIEMVDPADPSFKMYITFKDNFMVASFVPELVERSIKHQKMPNWNDNHHFRQVAFDIRDKKLLNFYFNYSQVNNFMRCFLAEENDMVKALNQSLAFSAFSADLYNERLVFKGYTNVVDSTASYLKALSKVSPGKFRAFNIVSDQAALYMAMSFDNFSEFYSNLLTEYSTTSSADYESYADNVQLVEKLLGIDVKEDFCSWVGNEIAFVKLRPSNNARMEDVVVVIHTNNITDARDGLDRILSKVRKRTPFKFETVNYRNYAINRLEMKGFFKLFMGKLLDKLEKPYFTVIEDVEGYVVFSNSLTALNEVIDCYVEGRTLARNKAFTSFKDEFDSKANVSLFVQMPKMYNSLYNFSNEEKRIGIKNNRDLILSFARIGFQLTSQNGVFDNKLIAEYDESVLLSDELEQMEIQAADDLYVSEFDTLAFKISPLPSQFSGDMYMEYFADQTIKYEAPVKNKMLNGLAKMYHTNGKLYGAIIYKDGKIDGEAHFYYADESQTKKAEMQFVEEKIDGTYKEYYPNGILKAVIEYQEGQMNGDCEFYYDSGVIKMKGKFRKGAKQGNWEYYDENGQLFDKERWRRGKSRDKVSLLIE